MFQLRVLRLFHCPRLSELPARLLTDLKQLRTLDLHANALTAIPADLADWHEVRYVDLSENKLDCNCEVLHWMAELVR
jgi:Leucine-rich repeat (LRR) protein